jgi:hypothetical protein
MASWDWPETVTAAVAAVALAITIAQWLGLKRDERLRLLLGEKETVAFEALRLVRRRRPPWRRGLDDDTTSALLLASLLSKSDRTRIQLYRALDTPDGRARDVIRLMFGDLRTDAKKYQAGMDDLDSFNKWSHQICGALPWLCEDEGKSRGPRGAALE